MITQHVAYLKLGDDASMSLGVSRLTADVVICGQGLREHTDFEIDRSAGTIRRLREFGRELYTFTMRYDDRSEANAAEEAALLADEQVAQAAKATFRNLPNWATWTAAEASAYIEGDVLGGWTKAELDSYVDTNVSSIATARTALKQVGEELIDMRAICERLAEAVIYLRDVAIRKAS